MQDVPEELKYAFLFIEFEFRRGALVPSNNNIFSYEFGDPDFPYSDVLLLQENQRLKKLLQEKEDL